MPDPPRVIAHDFPLRPDLTVRLVLPLDLTAQDDQRVAGFVHSLAFAEPPRVQPKGYRCPACGHGTSAHREHGCDVDPCECMVPHGCVPPGDPDPTPEVSDA